jgi:acetyl-CoA acetyltransferase
MVEEDEGIIPCTAEGLANLKAVEPDGILTGLRPILPMAAASMPAAEMALKNASLKMKDMKALKTLNPFPVNDINMARKMNFDVMWMNNYGSSLIFGHPQGPTAGRLVAELLEEVVMLGVGFGLWAGCAAGDTAAAMVFKIG